MADPRDSMRVETDCCWHCHGLEHKYHWTEPEYMRALNAALSAGKRKSSQGLVAVPCSFGLFPTSGL